VVKFSNNPQGRRILINEWIASAVLRHLQIATPKTAFVHVSEAFLAENRDAFLQLRSGRRPIEAGWHFGSRFPGYPASTEVYDFLPDALFPTVENVTDFRGVLAFDKWMGNTDARQAIFFRATPKDHFQSHNSHRVKGGMIAQMIDNGNVFQGADWRLSSTPIQGLYFRPQMYQCIRGIQDFEPWLTRIVGFPEEVLLQAAKALPSSWLADDEMALEMLLTKLLQCRSYVPDLIRRCRSDPTNPFPHWT